MAGESRFSAKPHTRDEWKELNRRVDCLKDSSEDVGRDEDLKKWPTREETYDHRSVAERAICEFMMYGHQSFVVGKIVGRPLPLTIGEVIGLMPFLKKLLTGPVFKDKAKGCKEKYPNKVNKPEDPKANFGVDYV
ncbi:hypothetical protein H2199_002096 [Coniosporium tulheliwenetii]|uniref:Uncharacterized protein n=1 Tax=Coniosporium tulheliwenetii TaxID=3383036 RepID=A0ACC2ZHW2_9PEZI|nr:hypothetical protein H2199_002096 [Cladosporium sp. JES 115]